MVWLLISVWALAGVLYQAAAVATDCGDQSTCDPADRILPAFGALAVTSPFLVVFALAAWSAHRAQITLTDDGIEARRAFGTARYAWSEIAHVANGVDTSQQGATMGRGQAVVTLLLLDGSEVRLPAPRAFGSLGRLAYEQRAARILQEWYRRQPPPE
jgi:hypothetical protein